MEILSVVLIIVIIVAVAVVAAWVVRIADRRRIRRRKFADDYMLAHRLYTTSVRQVLESKERDAKLLKVQLNKAKKAEGVASQQALSDFLNSCDDFLNDIKQAIIYDHDYFKSLPRSYGEDIAKQHEKWHDAEEKVKALQSELEGLRVLRHDTEM